MLALLWPAHHSSNAIGQWEEPSLGLPRKFSGGFKIRRRRPVWNFLKSRAWPGPCLAFVFKAFLNRPSSPGTMPTVGQWEHFKNKYHIYSHFVDFLRRYVTKFIYNSFTIYLGINCFFFKEMSILIFLEFKGKFKIVAVVSQ
jgi:hypothetical protein